MLIHKMIIFADIMAVKHSMNAISGSGSFERTLKIPTGKLSVIESRSERGGLMPAMRMLMVS
jgi:hypothetical protein